MRTIGILVKTLYFYMDYQALRTIEKNGLDKMAKDAGIDLWKLPFVDMRPERKAYLLEHPMEVRHERLYFKFGVRLCLSVCTTILSCRLVRQEQAPDYTVIEWRGAFNLNVTRF